MKKILNSFKIFFIVLSILSHNAYAGERVVLLTSLNKAEFTSSLLHKFSKMWFEHKMKVKFKKLGYEVAVVHHADAYLLWKELHRPDNIALFWISHGTSSNSSSLFLSSQSVVQDENKMDVKEVFREIHPNLRFLGIMSCNTKSYFDGILNSKEMKKTNPNLQWYAPDHPFSMREVNQILKNGRNIIQAEPNRNGYAMPCLVRQGYQLNITRHLTNDSEHRFALQVRNNESVLGVFPKPGPDEREQDLAVYLDRSKLIAPTEASIGAQNLSLSSNELSKRGKLIATTGFQNRLPGELGWFNLGMLSFSSPWPNASWEIYADRLTGVAFGTSMNIYKYVGSNEISVAPVEYRPFPCEPMPPLAL